MNQESDPYAGEIHGPSRDSEYEAIDLEQWQMEIENFIDETSTELSLLARALEGGPISLGKPAEPASQPRSESELKTSSLGSPGNESPAKSSDSSDRFASLKQRFANRIEKSKNNE